MVILRLLMVIVLLGSISTPAALPIQSVAVEHTSNANAVADDQHACCPSATAGDGVQTVTESAPSLVDCDNSCSDCQHVCHAGNAGLLSTTHFEAAHAVSERSRLDAGTAHFSTAPLERPPHRN